jgi:hypothetical protein
MEDIMAAVQEMLEKTLNPSPWQALHEAKKQDKGSPRRFQAHITKAPDIDNFYGGDAVILVVAREFEGRIVRLYPNRNEAINAATEFYNAWLEGNSD